MTIGNLTIDASTAGGTLAKFTTGNFTHGVTGNVTIQNGGTLDATNSTINVGGNWTNTANFTNTDQHDRLQ